MSDTQARSELVGYLVTTAKAHHKATGGVNSQWAEWYAEHLIDDVNRVLDADMSVDELAEWLIEQTADTAKKTPNCHGRRCTPLGCSPVKSKEPTRLKPIPDLKFLPFRQPPQHTPPHRDTPTLVEGVATIR
jgi:hypothetical protein